MNTVCFIINEHSNSGRAGAYIRDQESDIKAVFPKAVLKYISSPSTLEDVANEAADKYDLIVACGGDGSVSTIGTSVHAHNKILGVIPVGSGNDFAKSLNLKLSQDINYYLSILKKEELIQVDVPMINGKAFLNTVGIGFDGLTNKYAAESTFFKGNLKYMVSGLKTFLSSRIFKADINGVQGIDEINLRMAVLANGRYEGGKYLISPDSDNTDGNIELILIPDIALAKLLIVFLRLSFGYPLTDKVSKTFKVKGVRIIAEPGQWVHIDGEMAGPMDIIDLSLSDTRLNAIGVPA